MPDRREIEKNKKAAAGLKKWPMISAKRQAMFIAALNLLVGTLWVALSDSIVHMQLTDPHMILSISIVKGLVYILITSVIVYFLIYGSIKSVISEKVKTESLNRVLRGSNALLHSMLESSPQAIVFALNKDRRYTAFNMRHKNTMHALWGRTVEVGADFLAVTEGIDDLQPLRVGIERALAGESFSEEGGFHTSAGYIYLQEHYEPIIAESGEIAGVVRFSIDVTALKVAEQEKEYLSYHDKLTGLFNRRYYEDALVKIDEQKNLPIAIIMGDVNGLKLVNDAFGHYAGDELLKLAAMVLNEVCRPEDIPARWGGDEFIILLPNSGEREAETFIERVKEECAKVQGSMFNLDISFGWGIKKEQEDINRVIVTAEDFMYRKKMTESKSMRSKTLKTIMRTLHEKNPREEEHSKRVGEISRRIGALMGFSDDQAETLYLVGYLHDIGKIAIEEGVLNKPGRLTDDEFEIIKKHSEIGCRIIRSSYEISEIADAVLFHHERWDGKGYPKGLRGEEIPVYSRIITVADSYDAMISQRPYKDCMSSEEALREIENCSGRQFDPQIAELFINSILAK
jgi:diguanylate cyclase (GGDEF)-like protein